MRVHLGRNRSHTDARRRCDAAHSHLRPPSSGRLRSDPANVITVDVRLPFFRFGAEREQRSRVAEYLLGNETRELTARLGAIPGVQSIATTNEVPLSGRTLEADITVHSGTPVSNPGVRGVAGTAFYQRVSPNYIRTMGMTLVQGRDFGEFDASNESQLTDPRATRRDGAVLLNETAARMLWPDGTALGQYLSTGFDRITTPRRQVVGIVRDARSDTLRTSPPQKVRAISGGSVVCVYGRRADGMAGGHDHSDLWRANCWRSIAS